LYVEPSFAKMRPNVGQFSAIGTMLGHGEWVALWENPANLVQKLSQVGQTVVLT